MNKLEWSQPHPFGKGVWMNEHPAHPCPLGSHITAALKTCKYLKLKTSLTHHTYAHVLLPKIWHFCSCAMCMLGIYRMLTPCVFFCLICNIRLLVYLPPASPDNPYFLNIQPRMLKCFTRFSGKISSQIWVVQGALTHMAGTRATHKYLWYKGHSQT